MGPGTWELAPMTISVSANHELLRFFFSSPPQLEDHVSWIWYGKQRFRAFEMQGFVFKNCVLIKI